MKTPDDLDSGVQRELLLSRFRATAYAALAADVSEADLRAAFETVVVMHADDADPPPRPQLWLVPYSQGGGCDR